MDLKKGVFEELGELCYLIMFLFSNTPVFTIVSSITSNS